MKRELIAIVAGVAVLVSGLAWAASNYAKQSERARQFVTWKVDDALDELEATDAQRKTVHGLKDGLLDEGTKLHERHQELGRELVEQWKSPQPDANLVHAQVDRMLDDVRAFAHKAADAALTLHRTLTPEQRQEVLQQAEERRSRRWHH